MTATAPSRLDPGRFAAPASVDRLLRGGLAVGLPATVACVLGAGADFAAFSRAWLVACVFWLGIALGCLALAMIHHMTGGSWGVVVRRVFEAAAATLPLVAVLMLPLVLHLDVLYPWAAAGAAAGTVGATLETPETPAMAALLAHKAAYLNPTGFLWRFAGYFALWFVLTALLGRLSAAQDRTADLALSRRMRVVSGPGLVVWAFTVTFACFDWLMSLEPGWFSTIYGVYFFGGFGLSALAFLIVVARILGASEPMVRYLTPAHFHDWGKLMLAFLMLWAYFAFSQFLIIWAGNQPEEIEWYLHRLHHGWGWVALALVLFHFAVPFAILLSRDVKRNPRRLAWLALGILAICWVDVFWQVAPVFHPEGLALSWLDLAAPLAVGGLWLATFAWLLKRRPILPLGDPYLEEARGHD